MNHVEKTFILVACDETTLERQSLSEVIKAARARLSLLHRFSFMPTGQTSDAPYLTYSTLPRRS
jgi:hypothetical protein